MLILPRYGYYDNCSSYGNCSNGGWSSWGRWVLLAAIIIGVFFLFLGFSCITARRRRRRGLQPYRGTGWAGQTPYGHAPAQYVGPQQSYQAPPPTYTAPNNGYYNTNEHGASQGYFGGQQNGVELQQPDSAYQPQRGGDDVYSPPSGPPPSKKDDGIIR